MIPFIIIVSVILLIVFAYIFVLVRPRAKKAPSETLLCDYAHRGLHGYGVPENSLEAFDLACKEGFGIELDVQLSRNGVVMVFHDYSLKRMTSCEKLLCELDAQELQELTLSGTEQRIPTLERVLELVGGRVPLLVELKGEDLNVSLCENVAKLLREYKGEYCVESFNPLLIREMKKHLPDAFCGQLYTNVCRDKNKKTFVNMILGTMALNFISRPDFIAYNIKDRDSLPVKLTTKLFGATKFSWTSRSQNDLDAAHGFGEYAIFEK